MFGSDRFWLAVLAMLVLVLGWLRWRSFAAMHRRRRRAVTAFDSSLLAPRLRQVRCNHLGAVGPRPHRARHRQAWIAAARQAVGSLAYFRGRDLPTELHSRRA